MFGCFFCDFGRFWGGLGGHFGSQRATKMASKFDLKNERFFDRSWKRSGAPNGAITLLGPAVKGPRGGGQELYFIQRVPLKPPFARRAGGIQNYEINKIADTSMSYSSNAVRQNIAMEKKSSNGYAVRAPGFSVPND